MYAAAAFVLAAALSPATFDYDRSRPFGIEIVNTEHSGPAEIRDITFVDAEGRRTAAYLVSPHKAGTGPGVLFVHWYEPESTDSNRSQFLPQAVELAGSGATSLLIETMWSDSKWFRTRKRDEDYENSIRQVKELRRALDLLFAQRTVDRRRIAYVGHDFGAMYGAVLAGVEDRVHAWALQAGTTSFSLWYLLGTKLEPSEKQAVIDKLAPLDPVLYIGKAPPAAVLFQFGRKDPYVPEARAQEFFDAAKEPKEILWYDAGHPLNDAAVRDRQAWLKKQLRIK